MTRRRILAAMFSLALMASIPGVLAQTEVQVGEGGAGLEDLIGSFFNGEQIKGTFVAAPPDEPHNPYGDPVVLSDEFLAGIDLGISINLVINPNPFPILRDLDFDGQFNDVGPGVRLDGDPTTLGGPGDQILGDPFDADRDNILDKDQNDTAVPYDDAVIPPSHLMGGHETLEGVAIELAAPTLRAAPPGQVFLGTLPYNGPPDGLFDAAITTLEDGVPVRVGDNLLIIPPQSGPSKIAG